MIVIWYILGVSFGDGDLLIRGVVLCVIWRRFFGREGFGVPLAGRISNEEWILGSVVGIGVRGEIGCGMRWGWGKRVHSRSGREWDCRWRGDSGVGWWGGTFEVGRKFWGGLVECIDLSSRVKVETMDLLKGWDGECVARQLRRRLWVCLHINNVLTRDLSMP